MVNKNCCYIKTEYFSAHSDLVKVLDPGDVDKQSKRTYVFVKVDLDCNSFYLPLRNNLGNEIRPYGRIGHSVPSEKRPNAGLDYRYALIVNDTSYIEPHTSQKLPDTQYKIITDDYNKIVMEFSVYLRRYKKTAMKHRVDREPLFRESSLANFHEDLGITY